ncbi:hypothetical protein GUITHDRAFT_162251, partial [Guillardia theta CCMP2712]
MSNMVVSSTAILARRLPTYDNSKKNDSQGKHKHRKQHGTSHPVLLDVVDEERMQGKEWEWEKSGEYGRRAMQCGENLSKTLHFFGISNPLDIIWSHATNSSAKLERALSKGSSVMFLEADVNWGSCGSLKDIAVMAHPPSRTSDLTFQEFCLRVVEHNRVCPHNARVGVKFDFKDPRCIVPCLTFLREL